MASKFGRSEGGTVYVSKGVLDEREKILFGTVDGGTTPPSVAVTSTAIPMTSSAPITPVLAVTGTSPDPIRQVYGTDIPAKVG